MKRSRNGIRSFSALGVVLLLCGSGLLKGAEPQETRAKDARVQGGKVKCVDAPVTSVLQVTGQVTDSTNYRIEGDGLGPYYNGFDSVSSVIQGANCPSGVWGDWELNALSSSTRTFLVDLRQPVPGSGAQPIFTYQYVPARVIVMCGGYANAGGFPAMSLNQTLSCAAFVRFTYQGTDYRLAMTSGANVQTDYPETNNAQVYCTAVSSSTNKCVAWTVFPVTQAGGAVENIARLQRLGNHGADLGDFYTTFLFNLTNP
jgi:hypothetical protein